MPRATEFLRGMNGGVEVNRLVTFIGAVGVIGGAVGFTGYDVIWRDSGFDVSDFTLSLAGAVSILTAGGAGAVALKDRQVAMAKVISETNTVPAAPPKGPQSPVDDPDSKPRTKRTAHGPA